ncbi:MAG: alkene reductase [Rhodospirillales bacterium]|nr:alkene reductase [Rhodospirillales bacterium]
MKLFSPITVGGTELKNRIFMAPMARARCDEGRVPTPMVGQYYAQRASAGLIITEASSVSPLSQSRPCASAIYTDKQAKGWQGAAEQVHQAGGVIFQQIYHLGRKSDPSRMPDGAVPVAPSAIACQGQVAGLNGPVDFATPRALETEEIAGVVEEFKNAALNAKAAGMDGVEIHGANGYLIDQFLKDRSNQRSDLYGGSAENRCRFLIEIAEAIIDVFGKDRVGVRFSPHFAADGIGDSDPAATFGHAAAAMNDLGIAYIHLVEATDPAARQAPPEGGQALMPVMHRAYNGPLIVNGAYTMQSAEDVIASGAADAVAFANLYISNPDLVERFRSDAPLAEASPDTIYTGGEVGYVDYPILENAGV